MQSQLLREVLLFLLYKGGKPNLREVNEPGKNPSRDLNPDLIDLETWVLSC